MLNRGYFFLLYPVLYTLYKSTVSVAVCSQTTLKGYGTHERHNIIVAQKTETIPVTSTRVFAFKAPRFY